MRKASLEAFGNYASAMRRYIIYRLLGLTASQIEEVGSLGSDVLTKQGTYATVRCYGAAISWPKWVWCTHRTAYSDKELAFY